MPEIPEGLVPARYIGTGTGLREGVPCYNVDGTRRESLSLEPGDTLLMRDEDVLGKTLLFDPQGDRQPLYLGMGKVVLPEHANLSNKERADLGYEHHAGRPDFEAIEPSKATKKSKREAKEISETLVVEQSEIPAQEESERI